MGITSQESTYSENIQKYRKERDKAQEKIKREMKHYFSRNQAIQNLGASPERFDRLIEEYGIEFEKKSYMDVDYQVLHEKVINRLRKILEKEEIIIEDKRRKYFSKKEAANLLYTTTKGLEKIIKKNKIIVYGSLGIHLDDIIRIKGVLCK